MKLLHFVQDLYILRNDDLKSEQENIIIDVYEIVEKRGVDISEISNSGKE